MEFKIPSNVNDWSYQQINAIDNFFGESVDDLIEGISTFTGLDIDEIQLYKVDDLRAFALICLNIYLSIDKIELKKNIDDYDFIEDLATMPVGYFIDLSFQDFKSNPQNIIAFAYKHNSMYYGQKDHHGNIINKIKDRLIILESEISKKNFVYLRGIFLQNVKNITEVIHGKQEKKQGVDGNFTKNEWLLIVDMVAQSMSLTWDDVFKMNIIHFKTVLDFTKYKNKLNKKA